MNKQPTFEQMVSEAQQRIHFALLEDGSKGMYSAIHQSFGLILKWKQDCDEEENKKNMRKKK